MIAQALFDLPFFLLKRWLECSISPYQIVLPQVPFEEIEAKVFPVADLCLRICKL